jgi:hypothetical protein
MDAVSENTPSNAHSATGLAPGARLQPTLKSNRRHRAPPSLRPPTLMIDLLFGALMLFAFQMGDPSSNNIVSRDFDLPTANDNAAKKERDLIPLKPIKLDGAKWRYEHPDGTQLTASGVAELIRKENKTPVLLIPRETRVQSYIDAEQPLRRLGVKAGLAVDLKEGE